MAEEIGPGDWFMAQVNGEAVGPMRVYSVQQNGVVFGQKPGEQDTFSFAITYDGSNIRTPTPEEVKQGERLEVIELSFQVLRKKVMSDPRGEAAEQLIEFVSSI